MIIQRFLYNIQTTTGLVRNEDNRYGAALAMQIATIAIDYFKILYVCNT